MNSSFLLSIVLIAILCWAKCSGSASQSKLNAKLKELKIDDGVAIKHIKEGNALQVTTRPDKTVFIKLYDSPKNHNLIGPLETGIDHWKKLSEKGIVTEPCGTAKGSRKGNKVEWFKVLKVGDNNPKKKKN